MMDQECLTLVATILRHLELLDGEQLLRLSQDVRLFEETRGFLWDLYFFRERLQREGFLRPDKEDH